MLLDPKFHISIQPNRHIVTSAYMTLETIQPGYLVALSLVLLLKREEKREENVNDYLKI